MEQVAAGPQQRVRLERRALEEVRLRGRPRAPRVVREADADRARALARTVVRGIGEEVVADVPAVEQDPFPDGSADPADRELVDERLLLEGAAADLAVERERFRVRLLL